MPNPNPTPNPSARNIADVHSRFAAFVIDWHIRTIPIALWGFRVLAGWFGPYWRMSSEGHAPLDAAWNALLPVLEQPGVAATGWLCVLAYLLYHPAVELAMHGDSPGKRMTGIRVVSLDGSPPSSRQVLVRNLWRALEFLPVAYLLGMWAIWRSPENARIGDVRAGTRVIRCS